MCLSLFAVLLVASYQFSFFSWLSSLLFCHYAHSLFLIAILISLSLCCFSSLFLLLSSHYPCYLFSPHLLAAFLFVTVLVALLLCYFSLSSLLSLLTTLIVYFLVQWAIWRRRVTSLARKEYKVSRSHELSPVSLPNFTK